MGYSPKAFVASLSLFGSAAVLLVFVVLSTQISMALLPVVGIGGVFLQADEFSGQNAVVYPEYGELSSEYPGRVTDTAGCQQRPMLVFQLDAASVDGYSIFKDIKLPYFPDRWMSVTIDQPNGALQASNGQLKIFTTQLAAGEISFDNVRMRERYNGKIWGPDSGEFLLEGDPADDVVGDDLRATNVKTWVHAITGQRVNFYSPNGITLDVQFNTTSEIQNRYENIGIIDGGTDTTRRENYFDCLPGRPDVRRNPVLDEDFESGLPAGWGGGPGVVVNNDVANSGSQSLRFDSADRNATTPSVDLENEFDLSVQYWLKQGHDSFSENPDDDEYFIVEFKDERGEWNELDSYQGGPFSGTLLSYGDAFETFESGSEPTGWTFNNNASVDARTSNSGSYSAYTGELDLSEVRTPTWDLSSERNVKLEYWIRKGADSFSEDPDGDEDLFVQYQDSSGNWNTIEFLPANEDVVADGEIIDRTGQDGVELPGSALHANFQLRFIQRTGGGNGFDYWHIDDVRLTRTAFHRGYSLPEGAYHSDFQLRFRTSDGQSGNDYWHLDDVVIG